MSGALHVVVAGAGIAGLTAAALIAGNAPRGAVRVTLIDAADRPRYDARADVALRVSAVATGSAALLDGIGVWQSVLNARACPYERMRVWDEGGAPDAASTLRFDAEEFAVSELGFIVENDLLKHALLERLDALDVALRFGTVLRSVRHDSERWRLVTADEEHLDSDLLIGADGATSFVRSAAGIAVRRWRYGQTAFVTHVQTSRPHEYTARQRFLPDGPLGMLPLLDGRQSIVWSTRPETARAALAADDEALGVMLSAASDRACGEMTVAGPRGTFELAALHATQYVLPGLVLIGDAAHAVHPLAGQGANLGLRDARMLAEVVCHALAEGEHPGDRPILRRYERARKGANAAMLHFLSGLNRLFATDLPGMGTFRRTGMRAFNASGPLRKRAVAVALGIG